MPESSQERREETPVARSDEELVRLARTDPRGPAGRGAAHELLSRYRDRVYAWCLRFVRDRDVALDMAQDSLLAAYRRLDTFEGRARFSSWLYAIARNRCLTALRTPSWTRDEDADPDGVEDASSEPEALFAERESAERLATLMGTRLTRDEQTAIWLRCYECLPVEEITRILRLQTASGARGLLQTARRKLKAALREERASQGGRGT